MSEIKEGQKDLTNDTTLQNPVPESSGNESNAVGSENSARKNAVKQGFQKPKIGDVRPAPSQKASVAAAKEPQIENGSGQNQNASSAKPKIGDARPAPKKTSNSRRTERKGNTKSSSSKDTRRSSSSVKVDVVSDTSLPKETVKLEMSNATGRYLACVHVTQTHTQLAVLEGRTLVEHYVSKNADEISELDGNIYIGEIKNILPGMEAAFVDIGTPKNAVLYQHDVKSDMEEFEDADTEIDNVRIEQVLKNGQTILCQVIKNPIGVKGARLTQSVSLAGRYTVLVPGGKSIGISKRLDDQERRRLRRVVEKIRQ